MLERSSGLRLFQIGLHLWVLLFIISSLPAFDPLWLHPISPQLPSTLVLAPFAVLFWNWPLLGVPASLSVLIMLCAVQLLRPPRAWISVSIWILYSVLMHRAWLAGSGGQQLIASMLFWSAIAIIPLRVEWGGDHIRYASFWILRLQLLLAYVATALHKLTGTHWFDGTAMGIVAGDPAYGPEWLVGQAVLAQAITWAVLLFQLTFPIAVWWKRTRVPWMIAGILFHVGTAIWLGIPEMAAAFIVCYAIWLDEKEAGWSTRFTARKRFVAEDAAR